MPHDRNCIEGSYWMHNRLNFNLFCVYFQTPEATTHLVVLWGRLGEMSSPLCSINDDLN